MHFSRDADGQMRPLDRREFLKMVTVSAGVALAGCGRREANDGRVMLTQWYHQYGEEGTQQAVLRYAEEYTRARPAIAVRVVWVPGDYNTKINTALLTAGGPDVFEKQLSVPMVSAGQVAPLDDLFPPQVRRDFDPADLKANTVDGKIYGARMVGDTGLLYYRKSVLAKAGVAPPRTMDELIAVAKALSTRKQKGLFVGNDGGIGALLTIMPWSAGSEFLVDDRIVFNNSRTVAAYEKLRALNDSGALLIGAPTDWWDPSALNQGMAAMQWGGLWAYPAIRKALGEDVGGMAWPALDDKGKPATFSGGWSAMVNSQSKHLEEAKKYVKWLCIDNRKVQQDWNLSYGFHVPPRLSVARSAAPLQETVPATATRNLQKYGHALPPAWSGGMGTALTDAVTNIVKQGRSAEAEISNAARKCERELQRLLRYRSDAA